MDYGLRKELLFMFLQSDFVLFASVPILRLQLADLLEGEHGHFHLPESYVGLALPVVPLDVRFV